MTSLLRASESRRCERLGGLGGAGSGAQRRTEFHRHIVAASLCQADAVEDNEETQEDRPEAEGVAEAVEDDDDGDDDETQEAQAAAAPRATLGGTFSSAGPCLLA